MPHPPQEQDLRSKTTEWLPGGTFDEALSEAIKYHEEHPPLEFVGGPTTPPANPAHIERLERKKDLIEEVNASTIEQLLKEHRSQIIAFFTKRNVPPDIAGEIADTLVLA